MIEVLVLGQMGRFDMAQPLLNELYVLTAFLTSYGLLEAPRQHQTPVKWNRAENISYIQDDIIRRNTDGKNWYYRSRKLGNCPGGLTV